MHIVITANAAWNITNFRWPLVEAQLAAGHRVTVLAPADPSVDAIRAAGVDFMPLEFSREGLNPFSILELTRRLKRHFQALQPDVVLSYTIKNNICGALAARAVGIPFIPNVSGLGTAFLSGAALRFVAERLYRVAFSRLPVVFFQNPDDRRLFVSRRLIGDEQARLLPGSGIDLDRFRPEPPPPGRTVFLMIGRLLQDKGVNEYVAAARAILTEGHAVSFRLLGGIDASNRSAVGAEQAKAWHDAGTIEWLGTADDVRPHVAAAHCIVLPSYREGAPRTLIEGAAMGRPAIATDVPGCRQVVDDGVTGLLCRARDAASLADACRKFLALPPAARSTMGEAARRKMEREYDQRIVVEAYARAIAEATGQTR